MAFEPSGEMIESMLGRPPFDVLESDDARGLLRYEMELAAGLRELPDEVPRREPFVRFESAEAGATLARQGELTTRFFVLESGRVRSLHARDRGVLEHREYGPGEGFGETSALSHCPSPVSFVAAEPVRLVVLDERLLSKLYAVDAGLKTWIDEGYAKDGLSLHLAATELLRGLDRHALDRLAARCEFRTLSKAGEVLARKGEPADRFYLVRAGALRCTVEDEAGRRRDVAYYRANSSFGEHAAVAAGSKWPGDLVALMRTDVVALPREAFEDLRASDPDAHRSLTRVGNHVVADGLAEASLVYEDAVPLGDCGATALDEIETMVHGQSVKGGHALVIDQRKCVRCNMCVESCVAVHADRIPRISKVGAKVATDEVLITACYHCEVPECMLACGFGAIRRDPQGRIRFEYDNCVGCAQCIQGCPYGVIRLVEPKVPEPPAPGWWTRLLQRWVGGEGSPAGTPTALAVNLGSDPAGIPVEVEGKAIKCDQCAGLPFEACVYNCPTSAIHRRAPERLFRQGRAGSEP